MTILTIVALLASFGALAHSAPTYALTRGYLSITPCQQDDDCASGEACYYNRMLPGSMSCYTKDPNNQKRAGTCPLPPTLSVFSGPQCTLHSDCSPNLRCCTTSVGTQVCVAAIPAPANPKVTQIHVGWNNPPGPGEPGPSFETSTGIVQSKGKNILYDGGNYKARARVLLELRDKMGMYPEDIDMIVTSHGHPDHIGVDNVFPKLPHMVNFFEITGSQYKTITILRSGGIGPYNLFDDENLLLYRLPGHADNDISLLVKNTDAYGTIGLVGDTILKESDYDPNAAETSQFNATIFANSRNTVTCLSDWILPGHGAIFQVTDDMRTAVGGCSR